MGKNNQQLIVIILIVIALILGAKSLGLFSVLGPAPSTGYNFYSLDTSKNQLTYSDVVSNLLGSDVFDSTQRYYPFRVEFQNQIQQDVIYQSWINQGVTSMAKNMSCVASGNIVAASSRDSYGWKRNINPIPYNIKGTVDTDAPNNLFICTIAIPDSLYTQAQAYYSTVISNEQVRQIFAQGTVVFNYYPLLECNSTQENCSNKEYITCENNAWTNKGLTIGKCGVSCLSGENCSGYNYIKCENNIWVNKGNFNGKCGAIIFYVNNTINNTVYVNNTNTVYVNVSIDCNLKGCPSNYNCQITSGLCIRNDVVDKNCKTLSCPSGYSCNETIGVCIQKPTSTVWIWFVAGGIILTLLLLRRRQ